MSVRGSRRWRAMVMQHLRNLVQFAEEVAPKDPKLARRYVQMARRIVMRTRVRLPREWRHRYCHRCDQFLRPGINARVRTRTAGRNGSVVITCLSCGYRRKVLWTRHRKLPQPTTVKRTMQGGTE
ncbi:MAG: ribonuclease P protein component 4 [Candidatus Hodarchaeota archaeon]